MKCVLLPFILIFSISSTILAQSKELIRLRNLAAIGTLDAAEKMTGTLNTMESKDPVIDGYKGIAMLLYSKNCFSPFEKIKYFKNGKQLLEESVNANVTSVELRYLRFCVQTNVPSFVGYKSSIEDDKRLILQNWSKLYDKDLKDRIRAYMLRSEYCNDAEKRSFTNG